MTNHRKAKEIRNHRRLAIISDFSLLAPPTGLEPCDIEIGAGANSTSFPYGKRRPVARRLATVSLRLKSSREIKKSKSTAIAVLLLFWLPQLDSNQ